MMDFVLQTGLKTQTIIGGIHFVIFLFSWPSVVGLLRSYHDKDDKNFNCKPEPIKYIRQRCYDHYVSSLQRSPRLSPLDFAGISYGVLGILWACFMITGVWFKKQIERQGLDESKRTCLIKRFRAIFFCHVCFQLAVLVVMMVLFCCFQTLEFPASFLCTQGNITLSSTNQFPASNRTCNDSKYKEKSNLNYCIVGIMSISILLCILTILHVVVTRKEFFEQLIGDFTAEQEEQSVALVREAVDANNTHAGTTADGNDTQAAAGAVDANNTQSGEAVDANNTHAGTTADGNDTQAEAGAVDANNTQAGTTANGNDTQAEGTTADGNDTQAEASFEEHLKLNYLRVCHMVCEVLPEGLRLIFKQEWDKRYKTTLGEWQDTQKNGYDFFNNESKVSQKRNDRYLAIIKGGNSAEWDCTTLFYAIRYSSSIYKLNPLICSSVDVLREFRNTYYAHMAGAQLSDRLFKVAVRKVESAFQALGLSIAKIQTTKTSSFTDLVSLSVEEYKEMLESFKEDLNRIKEDVKSIAEQLEGQERQLRYGRHEQSFCVLPPVPPHQIAGRESNVATIVNKLDNLRDANKNRLSYFYISGNPGSGKSQLAGLVAKRVYDKTTDLSSSPSFVKTLNAENTETLLDSYVSLATKVSCPELKVTSIYSSNDKAIEEKIYNLKDLIETKISFYERWLLVVDNVTSLSSTLGFLPELGSEQWGNGQLIITTQDCSCVPPDSSLCCHTSISQGMMTSEASGFLATISGIADDTTGANNVAKALDYQPLALASAAFYVAKVRELHPHFSWDDYLKKIEEGKLTLTQEILAKANLFYPITMTAAIQIAVTRELDRDEEMKHVLTFLAFCAPQPLRLDILTNYVFSVGGVQDKEDVGLRIQGSSLILIEIRKDGVYIRLHQVVHDIVKLTVNNDSMNSNERVRIVRAAIISFNQFIEETMPWTWDKLDSVAQTKHFVGHLKTLSTEIASKVAAEELKKDKSITDISLSSLLRRLGRITQCNAEYNSARAFYSAAVKVIADTQTLEGSRELARGCTGLGRVTSSLGFHQIGKEHLERALSIHRNKLDLDNVEAARIYSFLGKVERRLGNRPQAKDNFNTSLLILSKLNLEQDNDAAHTYLHLGSVQCDLGDYLEAEQNLQLARSIYLEKFAPGHVNVGRTLHHLGRLQYEMANLPKAKEYLESALFILLEKLGTEHVEVARGYDLFGDVEFKMGKNQQAKEHFKLARSIFWQKLGPDHEDVERTTRSLSLCDNSP